MQLSRVIVGVLFLSGVALFGVMIRQVGLAGLLASFQAMGLWILPFALLESIPALLHTAAWATCFQRGQLQVRIWQLYLIRLAGSAINQVTPTATIGGEVVKVLLLESSMPRQQAAASVAIDKASHALALVLYLALGGLYVAKRLPLSAHVRWGMGLSVGLFSLGVVIFVVLQRYGGLSKVVHGMTYLRRGRTKPQGLGQRLLALDAQLAAYYVTHPWRFCSSVLLHFIGLAFQVIQTYILLHLLLGDSAPGFAKTVLVTVAVAALDQLLFFVPGRLGTLEGARFAVLSGLGIDQIYGLAFGLIARIVELFWSGLGLLAYAAYTRYSCLRPPTQPMPSPPLS